MCVTNRGRARKSGLPARVLEKESELSIYYFYDENEQVPFRYLSPSRQVSELPIPYATTMNPSGYVEFAIEDLAADTPRGYINAFSNVKLSHTLAHRYSIKSVWSFFPFSIS